MIAGAVGIFFLGRNWEKLAPHRTRMKQMAAKSYAHAQPTLQRGRKHVEHAAQRLQKRAESSETLTNIGSRAQLYWKDPIVRRGALILGIWYVAFSVLMTFLIKNFYIDVTLSGYLIFAVPAVVLYFVEQYLREYISPIWTIDIITTTIAIFAASFLFLNIYYHLTYFWFDPAREIALFLHDVLGSTFWLLHLLVLGWSAMRVRRKEAELKVVQQTGRTLSPITLHRSTLPYVALLTFGAGFFGFIVSTGAMLATFFMRSLEHSLSGRWGIYAPSNTEITFAIGLIFLSTIGAVLVGLIGGGISMRLGADKLPGRLGARLISPQNAIAQKVQEMAAQIGLPPINFIGAYDSPAINAFVTGPSPDKIMMCFSSGAVEKLSKDELEAVIGHELGHVANNDMFRLQYSRSVQEWLTWVFVFNGVKTFIRRIFLFASEMGVMHLSRSREFRADAIGARMTSVPSMAAALQKIEDDRDNPASVDKLVSSLGIRSSMKGGWGRLFATHPLITDRINALHTEKYISRLPTSNDASSSELPAHEQPE